jgi:glycosyltransferase involved in cell wall biosynthesis
MATILILIGGHLCTAPRPQKEADTLAAAGHDVTVCGIWFDPELVERDRTLLQGKTWAFRPVLDFRPQRWERWFVRGQAYLSRTLFRHFGYFSPALLGYGARAMLQAALQQQADLTIVHSEAGLWVGDRLLHKGLQVGVDFEDWFSQDLLPSALVTRPVNHLKHLEQRLAQHCTYCLAPSASLAEALAQIYQAPKPTVIYNVFPASTSMSAASTWQRDRNPESNLPSLHWFSQTIGPGRGLETLFQALPHLSIPVEIHLRGSYSPAARQWLEPQIPSEWRSRLHIHPTVTNDQLPLRIAEHDIGLALEQVSPPSRNLTITNKLFQYLQAGLAVIATDTAGQRELFTQFPDIGRLIPPDDPVALAEAIAHLLRHPEVLQTTRIAALNAVQERFCWEIESDRLLKTVEHVLATSSQRNSHSSNAKVSNARYAI